jgi:exodeoxyribonuclease VII large subunit
MREGKGILTVSELTGLVKEVLEEGFPSVVVEGEISNCRPASSGHLYFNLKDSSSMVQAVMFRYRSKGLGFEPRDGMLVRAHGAVTVYAARGQYQILVERLEAAGEGDILALLEERKRRLAAEGLFDAGRKRELPRFPSKIAVITSPTGAAVRDIINVVRRRNPSLGIVVLPAAVQGEAAPGELVAQLGRANRYRLGDVIIIGRGGGSLEDLLPFSDEAVVRAIAASDIPVISAVGHEIDWALSDFAADLRAPTPSAAAELVSESRAVIEAELAHLRGEFETAMRSRLERSRLLLGRFEPASVEARFLKVLAPSIRRHDEAKDGLIRGMDDRIAESGRRLELARASLEAASPQAVLERGFAVVRDKDGKAVRDAGAVAPGGLLDIQFAKGRAVARAEKVEI